MMPDELLEKLQRVSFATLGHLLEEGFVDAQVASLLSGVKLVGRARTVSVFDSDAIAINQALAGLLPGDVLVIDMQGDRRHACVGTVTACAARARGALGIVIDGMATDVVELRQAGLPVFARGTSLLTTKLRGNGQSVIDGPVDIGGVRVQPGDWVLGDDNGLLIAGGDVLAEVMDQALASDAAEPLLLERLQAGEALLRVAL
jgi:regulator of RNase E activity RraA